MDCKNVIAILNLDGQGCNFVHDFLHFASFAFSFCDVLTQFYKHVISDQSCVAKISVSYMLGVEPLAIFECYVACTTVGSSHFKSTLQFHDHDIGVR